MNNAPSVMVSLIVRSMDRPSLGQALASIALQTQDRVEVVLVNAKGGLHSDPGVHCGRFHLRMVNQGGAPLSRPQAANAGLDAAQGRYLAFLDDDDALDPDHLARLVTAIQMEGEDAVVYAGVRCIDKSDPQQTVSRVFGEPLQCVAQLLAGNFIPIHAPLFPAHLRQHARYDEALATYEDWDFWLQLAQHARFVYTDRVTATYFTGGTSGVSPQVPDMDAVRLATRALFAKWMLLTPDEFKGICNLYHVAAAELKNSRQEVMRLELALAESRLQSERLAQQLQQVYSSTSWSLTEPLRQLKIFARQFLKR